MIKKEDKSEVQEITKEFEKLTIEGNPVRRLKIGGTTLWDLGQSLFDKTATMSSFLKHESVPYGDTNYVNFLLMIKPQLRKMKYCTNTVGVIKRLNEKVTPIMKYVETNSANLLDEIKKYYIDEMKSVFARYRYGLAKIMFSQKGSKVFKTEENKSTTVSEVEKPSVEIGKNKTEEEPTAILILKELMSAAQDFCTRSHNLLKEEKKKIEETPHLTKESLRRMYYPVLMKYVQIWNNYFLAVLELDDGLSTLARIINEATEELLPTYNKEPAFSIWRVLVGAFKRCCYSPLKQEIADMLLKTIKAERESQAELQTRQLSRNIYRLPASFSLEEFLKGKITVPALKMHITIPRRANIQDLSEIYKAVSAVLDMNINEISVHYLKHSQFSAGKFFASFSARLKSLDEELYKKWDTMEWNIETYSKIMENDRKILEKILAPCLRPAKTKAVAQLVLAKAKKHIKSAFAAYQQLPKQEEGSAEAPHEISEKLEQHFGMMLRQAKVDVKSFSKHLHTTQKSLSQLYVANAKLIDQVTLEQIEDDIIMQKSKQYGIPLNDETIRTIYAVGGIREDRLYLIEKMP